MRNKSFWIQFALLWLPVILWASVIFSFSTIPTAHVSEIHWKDFIVKKLAHVTEYGIFALFLYRALKTSGMDKKRAGYTAIVLCFLYGLSDEFHQSFTPGREPAFRDVLFDTLGASLGIFAVWKLLPKAPPKIKKIFTFVE